MCPNLFVSYVVERRVTLVNQRIVIPAGIVQPGIRFNRFNRSLACLVPEPPAAAIGGFMQRDAVNPRLQARFAVEMFHSPKNFQEHFLCRIGGISWIIDYAVNQTVKRLVKLTDE